MREPSCRTPGGTRRGRGFPADSRTTEVAPSKLESRRHRDRRERVLVVPLNSETRATINHKLKEQNMRTTSAKNPSWWTDENDSAWERTKAALKRDWDQTKHDLGGDEPDTDQNVDNTLRQASGRESIPPRGETASDEIEPAHRFGCGAPVDPHSLTHGLPRAGTKAQGSDDGGTPAAPAGASIFPVPPPVRPSLRVGRGLPAALRLLGRGHLATGAAARAR